ncbi:MAG: hypothetical protein QOF78_3327 [Phycisphaerales bacterium]|nr:hypothetical protein [Phycisphaerales bacterium]
MKIKGLEMKAFHSIWWTLAVLLPDLLAFATRDWRAAILGAAASGVMIVLSVRVFMRGNAAGVEHDPLPPSAKDVAKEADRTRRACQSRTRAIRFHHEPPARDTGDLLAQTTRRPAGA